MTHFPTATAREPNSPNLAGMAGAELLATLGTTGQAAVTTRLMAAILCGSVATVVDRLFLPGNMYVSLTHTIPTRRLTLTLDELGLVDENIDAEVKIHPKNSFD